MRDGGSRLRVRFPQTNLMLRKTGGVTRGLGTNFALPQKSKRGFPLQALQSLEALTAGCTREPWLRVEWGER